jgi:hypothetical protein
MPKGLDQRFIRSFRRPVGLRMSGRGHAPLNSELAKELLPEVTSEQLVTIAGDSFRKAKRAAPVEVESLGDLLCGIGGMYCYEADVARESISHGEDRIVSFALGNRTDEIHGHLDETSSRDRHGVKKSPRSMG